MIELAAAKAFVGGWWKAAVGAAVVFPAAFLLGQCHGAEQGRAKADLRAAQAASGAQQKNHAASEAAAVQRLDDTLRSRQLEQDLSHADDASPDARPSDARRALLCARLREQAARGGPAVPAGC